jgi:hypothetical protein
MWQAKRPAAIDNRSLSEAPTPDSRPSHIGLHFLRSGAPNDSRLGFIFFGLGRNVDEGRLTLVDDRLFSGIPGTFDRPDRRVCRIDSQPAIQGADFEMAKTADFEMAIDIANKPREISLRHLIL